MVRIMASGAVLLRPQLFDKDVGTPALEGAGSLFDALDCWTAGDGCFVGEADGRVETFVVLGPDCRWCEVGSAGGGLVGWSFGTRRWFGD